MIISFRIIPTKITVNPDLNESIPIDTDLILGDREVVMNILIEFVVAVESGQCNIQVIGIGYICDITQACGTVLDVDFRGVVLGAQFLIILYDDVPALDDVLLVFAPVVAVQVESELLFGWPDDLVLVDQLGGGFVL